MPQSMVYSSLLFSFHFESHTSLPCTADTDIKLTVSEALGSDNYWATSSLYFLK